MSKAPRRYDASGRRQQAREAQERVLDRAWRLFAERGYAETTMEVIAEAAGVAVPTVYAAFGSKRGLLGRLIGRVVSGEPGSTPILQTAAAGLVLKEPDRRRALTLFASHMRQILERVGPVFEVMKSAARTDPEIAELYASTQRTRFLNLMAVARRLAKRGPLRSGVTIEDAGRTIWTLASPDVHQMLTVHARWSAERYERWLAKTLIAALLSATG